MSKASEWADYIKRPPRVVERPVWEPHIAQVSDLGTLVINGPVALRCDRALEFARWILDTFGEAGK